MMPIKSPSPFQSENPFHILSVETYNLVAIIAIVVGGVSTAFLLAGLLCPYWHVINTDYHFGVFTCYSNASGFNLSCSTGVQNLFASNSSSASNYQAAQGMSAISVVAAGVSIITILILLIRMKRSQLFDKYQLIITIVALACALLTFIFGVVTVVLMYYNIGNDESLAFGASNSPCGIVFAIGAMFMCLAFGFIILLLLYRQCNQEADDDEVLMPVTPPPAMVPKQQPKPMEPYNVSYLPGPDQGAYPDRLPPPRQIYRQEGAPVPDNPYGYTGEPFHDTQMHWLHRYYHHFAYNRPTYPYMPPANTVPPRG